MGKIISIAISLLLLQSSFNPSEIDAKKTLVVFEGSDWCAYCHKFDKKILKDPLFQDYLNEKNIELLRVDFPQRKKLTKEQIKFNNEIAEKFNFKGIFPTIIISNGNIHRELSYNSDIDLKSFIEQIDEFAQ